MTRIGPDRDRGYASVELSAKQREEGRIRCFVRKNERNRDCSPCIEAGYLLSIGIALGLV